MTRPIIGKMKTIVLPAPENGDGLTLEEYKEKYGIDLTDWLYIDSGIICFNFPRDSLILIQDDGENFFADGSYIGIVPVTTVTTVSAWESGVTSADIILSTYGSQPVGLQFTIDKSKDFEISNIIIQGTTY